MVAASVIIHEVAYAGTQNSQYEEWIELFNEGSDSVDVSNWKFFKNETTTLIQLSGTIQAQEYFLVCRTTGTLTTPLNGTCNAQGTFGGSGLSNTGEHLVLKDATGAVVDEINLVDGAWPVPGVAKGESMQRTSSGWKRGTPSPGSANEEPAMEATEQSSSAPSSSNATVAATVTKESIEFVKPDPKYVAKMTGPETGMAGVAVPFKVTVTQDGKKDLVSGKFEWSMGDGKFYVYNRNTPVDHIFQYPGDYMVTLVYYSNEFKQEPDSIHRKKVTIVPHNVRIMGLTDDGGVVIENKTTKDIALDGWILRQDSLQFVVPKYTTVTKNGSLAISSHTTGFIANETIQLLNPSFGLVSRYQTDDVTPPEESDEEGSGAVTTPASPTQTVPPSPNQTVPHVKTVGELFKVYRWYFIAAAIGLVLILAYFSVTLYATRNEFL
jgi:hypothetical protein